MAYTIDTNVCTGCGSCLKECPKHAIGRRENKVFVIDADKCDCCAEYDDPACADACLSDACVPAQQLLDAAG